MLIEIALSRAGETSLYHQVYEAIRTGILSGRLRAGARLPSTRDLAADLRVSRNTVSAAFDQLVAEGYLTSHVGRGTRVADTLEGLKRRPADPARAPRAAPGPVSRMARSLMRISNALPRSTSRRFTFSVGIPPQESFPAALWARLAARRARSLRGNAGSAMDPAGLPALREAIAEYYAAARGIRCESAHVVVVRGTQQALDLLARTCVEQGTRVAVEDPGFPGTRGAFLAAGARLVPVPVDRDGLRVEVLRGLQPPARIAVVTPAHQFPLGCQLTIERRLSLLAWARASQAWVLEDDYDSEFRFAGRPIATLRALDDRVIYLGTFSKTLVPALRLGFMIVPPELLEPLLAVRVQSDLCPPYIEQAVLADFIAEGHLARHLRMLRRVVRQRRDCLLEEGSRELRQLLALQEDETGLHLMGWLAEGLDAKRAAAEGERVDLDVLPLTAFRYQANLPPGLVLGFGAAREPDIRAAVRRLRRVLEKIRA